MQGPSSLFVNETPPKGKGRVTRTTRQAYFSNGGKTKQNKKSKTKQETRLKVSCTARSSKATLRQTTLALNVGCSKNCALAALCIGAAWQEEGRICLMDHDFHLMRFSGSRIFPLEPCTIRHRWTVAAPPASCW